MISVFIKNIQELIYDYDDLKKSDYWYIFSFQEQYVKNENVFKNILCPQ